MKKSPRVLCVVFALLLLAASFFDGLPAAFFSDIWQADTAASTGSVDVCVDNLSLNGRDIYVLNEETVSGALMVNSSAMFSFSVTNRGQSTAEFFLYLQVVWSGGLDESTLFIFPSDMSDELILSSLYDGIYDEAIAGAQPEGINEYLDGGVLTAGDSRDYSYKLFFYADETVLSHPEIFRGESADVSIISDSDLPGRSTEWAKTDNRSFSLAASDFSLPFIKEVPLPKTFFITQSGDIDLFAYAEAEDEIDGDISADITVSYPPDFAPYKAGIYTIVYNVKNSSGIYAAPLYLTITIWSFMQIESGSYHTLALTNHGQVYSWGNNYYGQLGHGGNASSLPKPIEGLNNIVAVAAGGESSYALDAEGQLYSWGNNERGQLGLGNNNNFSLPQAVPSPNGVRIASICAQQDVAGAVTEDGGVYVWGFGGYGALGGGMENDASSPKKLILPAAVSQLALNRLNGAAITAAGALYTWGYGGSGVLGTGSSTSVTPPAQVTYFSTRGITLKTVSVGWYHMAAVSTDGRLFTWGYGSEGRLGTGNTNNATSPVNIALSSAAVNARADYGHSAVLTEDGYMYLFGQNTYGKLGDGSETNRNSPVLLSLSGIIAISLGAEASFALTALGDVYGMGYGNGYALGSAVSGSKTPVKWSFVPPQPSTY